MNKLFFLSNKGIRNLSPKSTKQLGGVKRLQELIDELTNKNIDMTEKLMNEEKIRESLEERIANHEENCPQNIFAHKFYEVHTDIFLISSFNLTDIHCFN